MIPLSLITKVAFSTELIKASALLAGIPQLVEQVD